MTISQYLSTSTLRVHTFQDRVIKHSWMALPIWSKIIREKEIESSFSPRRSCWSQRKFVMSVSFDCVFLIGKADGINFSYRLHRFGVQICADGDALTSALPLAVRLIHDACAHKSRRHSHCESTCSQYITAKGNWAQAKRETLFVQCVTHRSAVPPSAQHYGLSCLESLWQLGEGNSIQVCPDVTTDTLLDFYTLTFFSKGWFNDCQLVALSLLPRHFPNTPAEADKVLRRFQLM